MQKPEPCGCKAYDFPHRFGGGKCLGTDQNYAQCTECGSNNIQWEEPEPINHFQGQIICGDCGGTHIDMKEHQSYSDRRLER